MREVIAAPASCARYVSRGGAKLEFALSHFGIEPQGWVAADLGCNIGGFVDCLLQHGARKVFAVDTCYGTLAWRLRNSPSVVVMERQNALHVVLPELVECVTVDVAWTPQHLILPRALDLLSSEGFVLSLLKPQYEASPDQLCRGVVRSEALADVVSTVVEELQQVGASPHSVVECPVRGPRSNVEYWLLVGTPR